MSGGLPEITEVQRLTLKPGDRIIVRVPARIDEATADRIKDRLRALLGDVQVLVLDSGMSLEVAEGP